MNTSIDSNSPDILDVRDDVCQEKIARIFARWAATPVGGHFILINQHEPVPVRHMLAAQGSEALAWEKLHESEDEARVKITRLAATEAPAVTPRSPCTDATHADAGPTATVVEIDVRGLPPPEPMMRIIETLQGLPAGGIVRASVDRRPVPLLAMLDQRGVQHVSEEQADGSWIVELRPE